MKVRVTYTVEVGDAELRGIRRFKGEKGIAQGREVKAFLEAEAQKSLKRVRVTREQEQREKARARQEREQATEEKRRRREEDKALAEESARRLRAAEWDFFIQDGFAATVPCGWCGEMKPSRGKRRSSMACKPCYVDKGAPTAAAKKRAAV